MLTALLLSTPTWAAQLEVPGGYATIQAAIDAAVAGDTVNVAAGAYVEQLTIIKPLTLQGAGSTLTTIRSPASASLVISGTGYGGAWKNLKNQDVFAVIGVKTNAAGLVTIQNLTVDGDDQGYLPDGAYPDKNTYDFQGIGVINSTVTIDTVKVTGIRELASQFGNVTPAGYLPSDQPSGMNHNTSIFAESAVGAGAHTLTIKNSTITKFQKSAIMAWGPTLTVDINHNIIQGYGKTLYSTGNGIQIASSDRTPATPDGTANGDRRGTMGSISYNQILDIGLVIPDPGQTGSYLNSGLYGPTGILLYKAGSGFQIIGNTISGPGVFSWHDNATSNDGGYGNTGIAIDSTDSVTTANNSVSKLDVGISEVSTPAGSYLNVSGNTFANNHIDIWGEAKDDQITLGSSAEVIAYNQTGSGIDTITNFGVGDKITVIGFATDSVNGNIGSNPIYMADTNNSNNNVVNGYTDGQPVVNFSGGSVTVGDGSNVAAKSVQVAAAGNTTTLYINTDGVSGAQLQVNLNGVYTPANFSLSGANISFVPTVVPVVNNDPAPPQNTTLPTGGGTATPLAGQTVIVSDNGSNGSTITMPSPTTTSGGTSTVNTIKVELPNNTGTVNVASNSAGTKLGVQNTVLPGTNTTVTTVTVDQGSASFTATKMDQPLAGLKNGIIVVSGTDSSKVTVDTTGGAPQIGIATSDTIIVPKGIPNVSGTVVDLPAPKSNGDTTPVTVKAGDQTITVKAGQADTKMTFQVVDIGGVQTPVLAVSGTAQVSTSGDNQLLVSVNGSVIRTGSSARKCNTIVQATSNNDADVVHVVTCYIVLPEGTFSALSRRSGNTFAAIKDGIVWAGETAEFDKNGKVTSAYLGTREGTTSAVGDDTVPGGNKFAANGFTNNAFIPRLTGNPLRLSEAKLDESLFGVFNTALNATTLPATPSQSAQGILNFQVNGGADSLQKAQAALTFDLVGDTVSVFPSKRIKVDTARADGISVSNEGNVEVASGGLVTTFVPTVADPQGFAADIAALFPGAVSEMRWNGSWKVTTSDGRMFVGRPQWGIQSSAAGNGFAAQADGAVTYSVNGSTQVLFPDFHDYTTLLATFSKELNDPNLKVAPRMNGSVQATVNGRTYLLYPQWTLIPASQITGKPSWWLDNGVVYIKNADGTAQGFGVK